MNRSNKLFGESTKKLAHITRNITHFENKFKSLKRKISPISEKGYHKPLQNNESNPEGLITPKPKKVKLERKDRSFTQITENASEIAILKSHVSELTSRISTFNRCIQNYEELVLEKEVFLKELNSEITTKNEESEKDHITIKIINEHNKSLKKQVEILQEKSLENIIVVTDLHAKIKGYVSMLVESEKSVESMKNYISSLQKVNTDKSNKLLVLEDKEKLLISNNLEKEEKIYKLQENIRIFKDEVEKPDNNIKLQEMYQNNEGKIEIRIENLNVLHQEKILCLEQEQKLIKTANEVLKDENCRIKEEFLKSCNEVSQRQESEENLTTEILQMKEKENRLYNEILIKKEENVVLQKELVMLKEELVNSKKNVLQKTDEPPSLKISNQKMLNYELEKVKNKLVESSRELSNVQEQDKLKCQQISEIQQELERRKQENQNLWKQLDVVKMELLKSSNEIRRRKKAKEAHLKEIIQMKQELMLNEKSLDLTKKAIQMREEQIKKLQAFAEHSFLNDGSA